MRVIPVELRPGAPEGAALGRGWHNFAVTTNRSRPVRAAVGLSLFRLALSASAFGEFPKGHRNGPFCCPSPVLHVQFRSCRVRAAASTKTKRAGHEIPALGPEGPRSLATARSAAARPAEEAAAPRGRDFSLHCRDRPVFLAPRERTARDLLVFGVRLF